MHPFCFLPANTAVSPQSSSSPGSFRPARSKEKRLCSQSILLRTLNGNFFLEVCQSFLLFLVHLTDSFFEFWFGIFFIEIYKLYMNNKK